MQSRIDLYKNFIRVWDSLVDEGIIADDPELLAVAWRHFCHSELDSRAFHNVVPLVPR